MSPGASSGGKVAMTKEQDIAIDEEFQSINRKLTEDEVAALRESLKRNGCANPLIVWAGKNILLDGHNRLRLCRELGVPFKVVEVEAADRDAAWDLIYTWQMARRNMSEVDRYMLAEKKRERTARLARERMAQGRPKAGEPAPNWGQVPERHSRSTTGALAKEAGMSRTTYERIGRVIKNAIPEVVEATREKKISVSRGEIIAALPKDKQPKALADASSGRKPKPFSIGDVLDNCVLKMEETLRTLLLRTDYGELDREFAIDNILPRLTKEGSGVRSRVGQLAKKIKEAIS